MENLQIKQETWKHDPVLVQEVCTLLDLPKKRNVVDATLGLGGHTEALLERLSNQGKVIAFDADSEHVKLAKKRLRKHKDRSVVVHSNFVHMADELKKARVRSVDAILFDLGLASPHVDNPERGFSFLREGPLDMRFDHRQERTAADVVNTYSIKDLIRIFQEYGEERYARKLAEAISKSRKQKPFVTTTQLAEFVEKQVKRKGRIHPATRIFQALRIEVNQELQVLRDALQQAVDVLKPGGRIAVISYHSLEDRIVKMLFRDLARQEQPTLDLVTKKPVMPTEEELAQNPRSRSAKLRIAQKL